MAVFMLVNTMSVSIDSLRPWVMKMILDNANNNQSSVYWYLGMLGTVIIVGNLINSFNYYLADKVKIPMSKRIREVIFKKVLDLDFAYHVDKNTGALISAFK